MRYNISVLDLHLIKRASYYSKQTLELHVYSISLAYGMTVVESKRMMSILPTKSQVRNWENHGDIQLAHLQK